MYVTHSALKDLATVRMVRRSGEVIYQDNYQHTGALILRSTDEPNRLMSSSSTAVSLFITGAMVNKDLFWVSKAVLPFLIIPIGVLMLMTYWPNLVLWLPRMWGYVQ
jgi:hypothetical protein